MFHILVPAAVVGGFVAYVASKPNTMRYHRQAVINAPAEKIFPLIEDFHEWTRWSPWEARDPNMQRTYSGANKGQGAIYEWNGNNQIGQGRMEILDTTPYSQINLKLDFIKPFEGHNITEFKLTPEASGTLVSWTMTGPANFMSKLMGTFLDMDKMIGKDFEQGLANLKREVGG